MNTVNAAGYLAGALMASRWSNDLDCPPRSAGERGLCRGAGAVRAVGQFCRFELCAAARRAGGRDRICRRRRAGGHIAQLQPARANFLLSLFYAGPGLGILASGLIAPFVLQAFGPGSWWIVWWAMTLLSVALTIPLLLAPIDTSAGLADAAPATSRSGRC